jgi:hypothetical protein
MKHIVTWVMGAALFSPNLGRASDDFPPIPQTDKKYVVRIAYLIPTNRIPRPQVVENLQKLLPWLQNWYAEQMELHGYGRKTFQFENRPGEPPPIHKVRVAGSDTDYHTEANAAQTTEHLRVWMKLVDAAQRAGVPVKARGQVWLLAYETHVQRPDGAIAGRLNRGGQFGRNEHSGVGTAVTTLLGMADESGMNVTAEYDGMTVPDVGPYPLRYGKSFETYAGGRTLGGIVSGEVGSMLHELSHAFGLKHDRRNDNGRQGNLMGSGYRGIRSEIYPRRFPGEAVSLSPASAAVLNVNRHFNSDRSFTDETPPVIERVQVGPGIVDGNIVAEIEATDDQQLAHATFHIEANVDGDCRMSGTRQQATLKSYHYKAAATVPWEIRVFDAQGNIAVRTGTLAIKSLAPHAPIPILKASTYRAKPGQKIVVDANSSLDPDSKVLHFEWDQDGDGTFDLREGPQREITVSFDKPGIYKIRTRVRDERHQTVSEPVLIRIME